LMPMTAQCGAAALCRGATTVRVAAHETSGGKVMVVWIAQSACSCNSMRNSWQSRPRHVQQCVPHNQPTPCMRCFYDPHSQPLEAPMQLSGLPRVFVHALAFSSTPSHANAAEFSSTPSHAAAAARALCSFHHSPRVLQLSDSRCSKAHRGSTVPVRHGHQTTTR